MTAPDLRLPRTPSRPNNPLSAALHLRQPLGIGPSPAKWQRQISTRWHRRIFRHITRMLDRGQPADLGSPEEPGGQQRGRTYRRPGLPGRNRQQHPQRRQRSGAMRRLSRSAQFCGSWWQPLMGISADAVNPAKAQVMELLEKASGLVMGLAGARQAGREPQSIDELLPGVLETLEQRTEKRGQIAGLPTGFRDLDRATCGLHPGDLYLSLPGARRWANRPWPQILRRTWRSMAGRRLLRQSGNVSPPACRKGRLPALEAWTRKRCDPARFPMMTTPRFRHHWPDCIRSTLSLLTIELEQG